MQIKHLVISGGGPSLFQTLGAIHHLYDEKIIQREKIETIYATSAGSVIGTLFCLKYDNFTDINNYLIQRPWKDVFSLKLQNILEAYHKKGIYDKSFFEKVFKPLFDAKDIPLNINLKDFYEYSGIEQHFFTFEINEFVLVDISYKTFPEISLIDALHMSCALPVIIAPVCIGNKCFIDGGVSCNFPLLHCTEAIQDTTDEILGFKNVYDDFYEKTRISSGSNLFEFIVNFLFKLVFNLASTIKHPDIFYHQVILNTTALTMCTMRKTVESSEERKRLFDCGVESAKEFIIKNKTLSINANMI